MDHPADPLADRLRMLGLRCDDVPTDRLSPAIAALACFPMYMVANVHAWSSDRQFHVPVIDWPGSEAILEAYVIGKQEGPLGLDPEHREVLGSMLQAPRPTDRIVYEYALETLRQFLDAASPDVVLRIRMMVAETVSAVARASGKGPLGSGRKVSPEERACIGRIASVVGLEQTDASAEALRTLDAD